MGEVIQDSERIPPHSKPSTPLWRVGIHTSISPTLVHAPEKAHQLGCTAFQIFSSSPRMWKQSSLLPQNVAAFKELRRKYDLYPLVIHVGYLVNLASQDEALRMRSIEAFRAEISRAVAISAEYLVLHPGNYKGATVEQGVNTLAVSIRKAAQETPFETVTLLIENSSGQSNALGASFTELQHILTMLHGLPIGCCIDTAHCYASGMDLSSPEGLDDVVISLQQTIGLDRVPVIHANDCRSPLGSHLDRHEHIGSGGIGLKGFQRIVNHPLLRDKTFILETPLEQDGDDLRNMQAILTLRSDTATTSGRSKSRKAITTKPARASKLARKTGKGK